MKASPLAIPDVLLFEPKVFGDERGFFYESFNQKVFEAAVGRSVHFVQDNHSRSAKGVLRGLHYQIKQTQGKLVRVTHGEVFDVAVDLRKRSPTFGKWVGVHLSDSNRAQLWIPEGLLTGLLCYQKMPSFCTRPPITGRLSTNAAWRGMTPPWLSTGRFQSRLRSPPKMQMQSIWLTLRPSNNGISHRTWR